MTPRRIAQYAAVFIVMALVAIGLALLLVNITTRKQEAAQYPLQVVDIADDELDPAVWGQNFPSQYDTFKRTEENYGQTPHGGSEPFSRLDANPDLKVLWAGYAFSIDYNEERGHFYAQQDQEETERVQVVDQPGACLNCHAAEAPGMIAEMGWEEFNHTPYNDLVDDVHLGSSCADCHDPDTMALRITRPAFQNAMEARGIDLSEATRQDMRSYVCAQCHVEYYFAGDNKVLTFPWTNGLTIDGIEQYYEEVGHIDWTHKETGGKMLKMQHPDFELWSTGIHAASGVACADCHMPYVRQGSVKVSDHWVRSPLTNLNNACQTCHNWPEEELRERVVNIQDKTADLLERSERALVDAIEAIAAARAEGATDEDLEEAMSLHRAAQMRWDFIASENSTGFHSPQEAARILAESIDMARQAQMLAREYVLSKQAQ
jgi:nitrite reductase (cytochrome c-552)